MDAVAAGGSVAHDVSVPLSRIADFIDSADAALAAAYPDMRRVAFGHVGDGNMHYNPIRPRQWDEARLREEKPRINRIVHDIIVRLGGSISAEHGIGRSRLAELEHRVDRVAILEQGRLVAYGRLPELRQLAGLPIRIRVRLPGAAPPGLLQPLGATSLGDGLMELEVVNGGKVQMLGALAALQPAVEDTELILGPAVGGRMGRHDAVQCGAEGRERGAAAAQALEDGLIQLAVVAGLGFDAHAALLLR